MKNKLARTSLNGLKEEQTRQVELGGKITVGSKAGKRREFGQVMWKVTSQEIQRRTKRAFLRICSIYIAPVRMG